MRKLQGLAIAPSMKRVYKVGLHQYHTFCHRYNLSMLPLRQSTLQLFVTYLAHRVAFKTINLYLSTIKHFASCKGYPHNFQKKPQLHLLLKGTKHALGATGKRKPRYLVTISILWKIKSFVKAHYHNKINKRMLWAACTLAFFAFLHSSEYTSPSTKSFNKNSTLQVADIKVCRSRLILQVKASRTGLFWEGVSMSIVQTGGSTCPVKALQKYLRNHPSYSGPLFQMASGRFLIRKKDVQSRQASFRLSPDRFTSILISLIPDWCSDNCSSSRSTRQNY